MFNVVERFLKTVSKESMVVTWIWVKIYMHFLEKFMISFILSIEICSSFLKFIHVLVTVFVSVYLYA